MKEWLTSNKVFFETLGVILPSILAVALAYQSYLLSNSALKVSEETKKEAKKQNNITEKLNRPFVNALFVPQLDDNFKLIGSRHDVINNGELIRDITIETYEYLVLECAEVNVGIKDLIYPIRNYVEYSYLTGDTKGVIAKIASNKKFDILMKLYDDTIKMKLKDKSIFPNLNILLHLNYETKFGESDEKYFILNPNGATEKISKKAANKIIKYIKQKEESFSIPYLSDINKTDLYNYCRFNTTKS